MRRIRPQIRGHGYMRVLFVERHLYLGYISLTSQKSAYVYKRYLCDLVCPCERALYMTAYREEWDAVRILITLGSNVNFGGINGCVIDWITWSLHLGTDLLEQAIDAGADINKLSNDALAHLFKTLGKDTVSSVKPDELDNLFRTPGIDVPQDTLQRITSGFTLETVSRALLVVGDNARFRNHLLELQAKFI